MQVLLIEDEALQSEMLQKALKEAGMEVHAAYTGREGIDLAFENYYHCVVLDIGLPDMSGFELLYMLRMRERVVPVIILSGAGDRVSKTKAWELGVYNYLVKPFEPHVLIERIELVAGGPHAAMTRSGIRLCK